MPTHHRFTILGSSSSGNASLLETENGPVLIDAGFSAKKLDELLQRHGHRLSAVEGIFLTHEHSDHAQGLVGLRRHNPRLPVYANYATAQALERQLTYTPNWQIFETGCPFRFRNLTVHPFSIPHDAYDPVGFTFTWRDPGLPAGSRQLTWATDLGHIPPALFPFLSQSQTLVLETNYDPELLKADTKRPPSVKQRIQGRHGHLSNLAACQWALEQPCVAWEELYLAHLSRDCNQVTIVEALFGPLAQQKGFRLQVIDPYACS